MKTKLIFKTSLLFLFILLCSFAPKKELPPIVNFTQRFMPVDTKLHVDKYAVTIRDYKLFLDEKKKVGENIILLMYDTTIGHSQWYFNEKNAVNYFPIVCVSHYGATEFCKWLTEKYNMDPKRKYKKVIFRLPTEMEYKKATMSHYDTLKVYYPWGENVLSSYKGKEYCSFLELQQVELNYDRDADLLVYQDKYRVKKYIDPFLRIGYVNAHSPNPYGLYNMVGNVAEMIDKEHIAMGGNCYSTGYNVRFNSKQKYDTSSHLVGFRVYMEILEF